MDAEELAPHWGWRWRQHSVQRKQQVQRLWGTEAVHESREDQSDQRRESRKVCKAGQKREGGPDHLA